MRAPVTVPILLAGLLVSALALPILADDPSPLDKAVQLFRSPHAGARTEGTRIADRELRRLLAPLLAAMRDKDPEVRRRAQEVVLALVPYHEREPETQQERQLRILRANQAAIQAIQIRLQGQIAKQVRVPRVVLQPVKQEDVRKALEKLQARQWKVPEANQAAKAVQKFGLDGNFPVLANQMRGLRVTVVTKDSQAAKVGLAVGDTIVAVNGKTPSSFQDILAALHPRRGWSGARLQVLRNGRVLKLDIP